MTAYRQRALECAAALADGQKRVRDLAAAIPEAPKILVANYYEWFERASRGVYTLSATGRAALDRWPQSISPPLEPTMTSSVAVAKLAEEHST